MTTARYPLWLASLCRCGRLALAAGQPRSPAEYVYRRHRPGGHQVHAQQRARGQEVSAGDAGRPACAFFDADGDGWPDILLINSKDWTPRGRKSLPALYRNNHNGTFTDVTAGSGLDVEMYGMGVAIGDYDNDGRDDVYITALEGDHLFHNEGNGKFRDVTQAAGINNASFGTSAAWLDYDRDGKLDLFVANYVQWTPESDSVVLARRRHQIVLHARIVQGHALAACITTWAAASLKTSPRRRASGDPTSKSLGVTVLDYNGDGWPDIFVANDTQPNKLYRNNRNGTFTEEAWRRAWHSAKDGVARGAMGADAADYDRSRPPAPAGGQLLEPDAGPLSQRRQRACSWMKRPPPRWAAPACSRSRFGVFFFDYDLDGYPDIFAANGHIEEEIGRVQPKVSYSESPLLFRNLGNHRFDNVTLAWGRLSTVRPIVARGAAYADFDHDGDLDLLITTNNGPALSVPQRRRQPQPLAFDPAGRHEIQPRRHRRGGARRERFRKAVEHGAQRIELLLAERPGADLRAGQGFLGFARNRLAQRDHRAHRQRRGQSIPID